MVSGWFITLIGRSRHIFLPWSNQESKQKHCYCPPFGLDKDLDEWVASEFPFPLRWGLLVTAGGANPSLWPQQGGAGLLGDWLLSLQEGDLGSTSWLVEGGFVTSLCCLVSSQSSPLLSCYRPSSHLFTSVVYGLCSQGEASSAITPFGNLLLPVFRTRADYFWSFLKA